MSILACDNCGELIDTDDEPEAYIEKADRWLCWWCREGTEEMTDKQDWTGFHIDQVYRASASLRNAKRRLSWQDLEHLKDAHRWLSETLKEAQKLEEEAKHGQET